MNTKPSRNDPCPCGSGKKFKHCCLGNSAVKNNRPSAPAIHQAMQTAWMYQRTGRYTEAEALSHQIIQALPNHPDALHLLGVLALQYGNTEVAASYFERALKGNGRNPMFYSNLGLTLHEQGKLELAEANYRKAIALDPAYADAYYNLHALLLDSSDLSASIRCLEKVLQINSHDSDARLTLGILLDYSGNSKSAEEHLKAVHNGPALFKARLDAWQYLKNANKQHLPLILGSNIATFKLALQAARIEGLIMEFGVRHGNTLRQIAGLVNQKIHGFDSFEGLPEIWHHEPKGSYTTKGVIPTMPHNVELYVGWFEDTLPEFLEKNDQKVRFINIDCDIYSSTKTVLDLLASRIVPGTVIVFDEYIGNEHWREDEFKAFQQAVTKYNWRYEYLSFSIFTKQVTVRIL